ncbi:MAG: hypothetical protein WED05_09845 [Candidatus Atabeyarchaeum deiterrae]
MPDIELKIRSRLVGTIHVESTEIRVEDSPEHSKLIVPATLDLSPFDRGERSFIILRAQCSLFLRESGVRIADSKVSYDPFQVRHPNQLMTYASEFHVDPYALGKIEASRESDLKITLDFHFLVGLYAEVPSYQYDVRQRQKDALEDFEISSAKLSLDIPQPYWENKVLPSLRQGKMRSPEASVQTEAVWTELATPIEGLRLAETYFANGAYDECVEQCQTVIETIKNALPKFQAGIQGGKEYEWIAETTSTAMEWLTRLYQRANESTSDAHHPLLSGRFSQHDAEVIMLVTVALVAYVERSTS